MSPPDTAPLAVPPDSLCKTTVTHTHIGQKRIHTDGQQGSAHIKAVATVVASSCEPTVTTNDTLHPLDTDTLLFPTCTSIHKDTKNTHSQTFLLYLTHTDTHSHTLFGTHIEGAC